MTRAIKLKIGLWLISAVLIALTMYFMLQGSICQTEWCIIYLGYLLITYRNLYFFKVTDSGSNYFSYTDLLQIMKAWADNQSYRGVNCWCAVKSFTSLKEVISLKYIDKGGFF